MFEESVSNTIPSIFASMYSWFTPAVLFVLLNVMIGTIAFTSTLANQRQNHQNQQQQQQQQHHRQENYQNDSPQQPNKLVRSSSVLQRLRSINFYNYRSQEQHHPIIKTAPDSDTLYNFDQTHQPQNLEAHAQYIFEQTHQEKQSIFGEQVQEAATHYFFEQTHEENAQQTPTHFVFPQAHKENAQENETHFDFERTQEENARENRTDFDFERTHEENEENEVQSLDEVYSQLKERHVSRSKSDTKPVGGEIPARLPAKMKKSASLKSAFKHFEEEDIVEARRPETVRERGAKVTEVDDEVDAKADDFINKFKHQLKLQRLDSLIRYKNVIGRGSGK
ncbi:hypothetical protein ACH5RR_041349 [Cinchona calisaya]|uniref:DUF4408 domain-containing protein n=1 Tax=Cinchona calisaya TaxID=153742 RepID=A0ABD2XYK0_9GENT